MFAQGGSTSKALIFRAAGLPVDHGARDWIFLCATGSPDPYGRQPDGIGGVSSLSRVCILAIPGVAGSGAPVHLDFSAPSGAFTGALLPTGFSSQVLDEPGVGAVTVSMIAAGNAALQGAVHGVTRGSPNLRISASTKQAGWS